MVGVFVRRCRARGLAPFVSLRLNDSHGHEFADKYGDEVPEWRPPPAGNAGGHGTARK